MRGGALWYSKQIRNAKDSVSIFNISDVGVTISFFDILVGFKACFVAVCIAATILNACATEKTGVAKSKLPGPRISGPTSSEGTYTISWGPQREREYGRLKEWTSSSNWKDPQKINGKSKTYNNKVAGMYKYMVKTCEWDSESRSELCTSYSAVHTVRVGDAGGSSYHILDGGRTIVSTKSMFATANLSDLDKDGIADSWENRIASLSMPALRLDEEENFLDHPEHHLVDFVRVVPVIPHAKNVSAEVQSPQKAKSKNKLWGRPKISGPSLSTGSYTISWTNRLRLEYAKLQEWACSRGWGDPQKINGNSKAYHTKPDGTYKYKVKICFYDPEMKKEFCSPMSAIHKVVVDNPEHMGYLLVVHAFSWSRDYGRFYFNKHNGDVERVVMLWKIINDKRIHLEYVYTAAHEGTSTDHSGVWRACVGCMSCNLGKIINGSTQLLCIKSLQFESNRLRIRASEDKHAIYPRKKLCEDVVLAEPLIGEDCGDGPLYDIKQIKIYNVGEPWAGGQLIDRLNDHQMLRNVFPNEEIWIEALNSNADRFCGGLGIEDECPNSVGSKLDVSSGLMKKMGTCGAPGPFRQ